MCIRFDSARLFSRGGGSGISSRLHPILPNSSSALVVAEIIQSSSTAPIQQCGEDHSLLAIAAQVEVYPGELAVATAVKHNRMLQVWILVLALLLRLPNGVTRGCAFLLPTTVHRGGGGTAVEPRDSTTRAATAATPAAAAARTAESVSRGGTSVPFPPPSSVYVNLPFCRRRCFYCDFPIKVCVWVRKVHECTIPSTSLSTNLTCFRCAVLAFLLYDRR